KVILHGIGYGGAVAIWARQRFPSLIDGAWGSTPSVIARVNFPEYGEDLGNTIRRLADDGCFGTIWRGFRTAENLIDAGLYGRVSEMFRTCEPLAADDPLTVETFFYGLKTSIEQEMFGEANPQSVVRMCQELASDSADTDLEVLANFFARRYAPFDCVALDFESNIASALYEDVGVPVNAELGVRQRLYQLCTEFGWFLTSSTSGDSPFGTRITYRYFIDTCRAVFGDWIDQEIVYDGVRLTNLHFGADDPRVTNALYVNAEFDPSRFVSITSYTNTNANAFVIDGALIAMDWLSPSDGDSDDLRLIKEEIKEYVYRSVTFLANQFAHPHPNYIANRSEAHRFRTRVDHFDVQNRATFEFDYLSNSEYYLPGRPIFIVVGSNSVVNGYFIENGLFHDIARGER
ncbi:putative serine protease K12H4.7, partial [Anopheles cruzii]|uniref:putative serine protease K12H4.7 n=1 Tax=Anopheles cruzii TaxID=68878 RepID=UPI0022EC4379